MINGKVTNEIEFLTAAEEDKYIIAQANAPIDDKGKFINPLVKARKRDDYPMVTPDRFSTTWTYRPISSSVGRRL